MNRTTYWVLKERTLGHLRTVAGKQAQGAGERAGLPKTMGGYEMQAGERFNDFRRSPKSPAPIAGLYGRQRPSSGQGVTCRGMVCWRRPDELGLDAVKSFQPLGDDVTKRL